MLPHVVVGTPTTAPATLIILIPETLTLAVIATCASTNAPKNALPQVILRICHAIPFASICAVNGMVGVAWVLVVGSSLLLLLLSLLLLVVKSIFLGLD